MTDETETITAADFAQRRGLRESAVVHRIRAGIYPGKHEDGVWYVLRGSARSDGADISALPPARPPVEPPETKLPWDTVEGPFPWVLWVVIGALVLQVLSMLAMLAIPINAGLAGVSFGTVMTLMFSSLVYEGVRTGTARGQVLDYEYSERPFGYVFQMAFNVLMGAIGLVVVGISIQELLR